MRCALPCVSLSLSLPYDLCSVLTCNPCNLHHIRRYVWDSKTYPQAETKYAGCDQHLHKDIDGGTFMNTTKESPKVSGKDDDVGEIDEYVSVNFKQVVASTLLDRAAACYAATQADAYTCPVLFNFPSL